MKKIILITLLIGLVEFCLAAVTGPSPGLAQEQADPPPAAGGQSILESTGRPLFPVYKEGDYFDQAIYDQTDLVIRLGADISPALFYWSTLFLSYTRNYLGLQQFAELMNVTREAYPEGLGPVLILYKTWRLNNPSLRDAPVFMDKLKDRAAALTKLSDQGPQIEELLSSLEEYIEKNEAYGRELDALAEAGLAAVGLNFSPDLATTARRAEPAPPQLPLYDDQVAGQFERVLRALGQKSAQAAFSPVYHSHFSVPNPAEIMPLTRAFDALALHYGFNENQMAAAAFAINTFVYEGLSGRILKDDALVKYLLTEPMGESLDGAGGLIGEYISFQSVFYGDLETKLRIMAYLPESARAGAGDIWSRLRSRRHDYILRYQYNIGNQLAEMNQKERPTDPKKLGEFIRRYEAKRVGLHEYRYPEEYRRRGSGFGRIY